MQQDIESFFLSIATPGVQGLHPYQPGKPLAELEREYGISNAIKLASNENPLGPSPAIKGVIEQTIAELARYPDGNGFALKNRLVQDLDVAQSSITLGNGSSDIIEFAIRAFASRGDEVVFSQFSFAMYPILTQMVGAKGIVVPATDWGHDLSVMLACISDNTKLVFIANPNNPTGTWLKTADIEAFLKEVPKQVIVIVDEAYFEYVQEADYTTTIALIDRFPNLIVTRTFSKAYGLAGLRIGYGVSHPAIADILNRVRPPFNTNSMALVAAEVSLNDVAHRQQSVDLNRRGMQQLEAGFRSLDLEFIPSVGNFIAVNVKRKDTEIFEKLLRLGVIVRPVGNYEMHNMIRVTVGLEAENSRFLDALGQVL